MARWEKQLPWSTRTWVPSQDPALGKLHMAVHTYNPSTTEENAAYHQGTLASLPYLLANFLANDRPYLKKRETTLKNNAGSCPLTSTCILNICRHDLIHMWTQMHTKSQNRNVESKNQHQLTASWLILAMFKKVFGVCLYAYFMQVHVERLVCCSRLWLWRWEGRK